MNEQTQSVSVEEKSQQEEWGAWKFVSDMLDNPDPSGIYQTSKCYEQIYDFVVEQKQKALHTHSLATEEKNERLLLCLEDREKTIREQTQYIEAIRGAAGMGFNEFHEAIATKRGITLSDSK